MQKVLKRWGLFLGPFLRLWMRGPTKIKVFSQVFTKVVKKSVFPYFYTFPGAEIHCCAP